MSVKLKSDTFLANMWSGSLEQNAEELSGGGTRTSFESFTNIAAYQELKENENLEMALVQRLGAQLTKDAGVLKKFAGNFEEMDIKAGKNAFLIGR